MKSIINLFANVGGETLPDVGAIPNPDNTGVASGNLLDYIENIVNWGLGFVGIIVFLLIVYAGFLYLTASGNQDQTKKAIAVLQNTVIGAIMILFAFVLTNAIVGFVFQVQ